MTVSDVGLLMAVVSRYLIDGRRYLAHSSAITTRRWGDTGRDLFELIMFAIWIPGPEEAKHAIFSLPSVSRFTSYSQTRLLCAWWYSAVLDPIEASHKNAPQRPRESANSNPWAGYN